LKKILASQEPVTLALDGWTNVNHHKVTNLVLLNQGRAYFWSSVQNDSRHNTAGTTCMHRTHNYIHANIIIVCITHICRISC
jgi:hypothetical protein